VLVVINSAFTSEFSKKRKILLGGK